MDPLLVFIVIFHVSHKFHSHHLQYGAAIQCSVGQHIVDRAGVKQHVRGLVLL